MKSTKNIIDKAADGLSDYAIFAFFYIVLVLYMDSALNMDTPYTFKSNKLY